MKSGRGWVTILTDLALFDPGSDKPFALSRSKVELFLECPRCFYLDRRDLPAFDAKLEFTIRMLPHDGDDAWVEGTLRAIRESLSAANPPDPGTECEYCDYVSRAGSAEP